MPPAGRLQEYDREGLGGELSDQARQAFDAILSDVKYRTLRAILQQAPGENKRTDRHKTPVRLAHPAGLAGAQRRSWSRQGRCFQGN